MSDVLVVDDSPDIRLLARTLLLRAGHQVREAGGAEEALALIVAEPPDVVLLDLQLPGMDGWGLLGELRAQGRLERTRVVVFSAHVNPTELRRAPEEGGQPPTSSSRSRPRTCSPSSSKRRHDVDLVLPQGPSDIPPAG